MERHHKKKRKKVNDSVHSSFLCRFSREAVSMNFLATTTCNLTQNDQQMKRNIRRIWSIQETVWEGRCQNARSPPRSCKAGIYMASTCWFHGTALNPDWPVSRFLWLSPEGLIQIELRLGFWRQKFFSEIFPTLRGDHYVCKCCSFPSSELVLGARYMLRHSLIWFPH